MFHRNLQNIFFNDKFGKYVHNSLHLAQKYARIFVRGHYLFRVANSFPRAYKTVSYEEQIMAIVFINPSYLFCKVCSFENWGIFSDIPSV